MCSRETRPMIAALSLCPVHKTGTDALFCPLSGVPESEMWPFNCPLTKRERRSFFSHDQSRLIWHFRRRPCFSSRCYVAHTPLYVFVFFELCSSKDNGSCGYVSFFYWGAERCNPTQPLRSMFHPASYFLLVKTCGAQQVPNFHRPCGLSLERGRGRYPAPRKWASKLLFGY